MQFRFLLYVLSAFLMLWVLSTAWKPAPDSYLISGEVEAITGSLENASLKYSQKPNDTNFEEMRELDVLPDGRFSGAITIKPRGTVYFYFWQPGLTTVRESKILKEGENDLGTLKVAELFKDPWSYRRQAAAGQPLKLQLYQDNCLTMPKTAVEFTEILFFEDVEALPPQDHKCENLAPGQRIRARLGLKGESQLSPLLSLQLLPDYSTHEDAGQPQPVAEQLRTVIKGAPLPMKK